VDRPFLQADIHERARRLTTVELRKVTGERRPAIWAMSNPVAYSTVARKI
jgi:hypothetical protein